jgi:predicted phosphodiesterase
MLNDAHLREGEDPDNSYGKLSEVVAAVLGQSRAFPDVLVLGGDMFHEFSESALERLNLFLAPLEGALRLAVPGNHDMTAAAACLRDGPSADLLNELDCGAMTYRGVRFVLLNNAQAAPTPWKRRRDAWLAAELAAHAALPKLIVCHVPLLPMRQPEVLAASFNFPTWVDPDAPGGPLELIERHRKSVIAVLSGHLHLTARVERNGIHHIVPSGSLSWPHDACLIEFYGHQAVVSMVGPILPPDPGSLGRFPWGNGIHERLDPALAFTDDKHPDSATYMRGTTDEREWTIAFHDDLRISPLLVTGQDEIA